MESKKLEPRYQKLLRKLKQSRLGKIWNSYIYHYSSKTWLFSKRALWSLSVGSVILIVPLAIETLLESEARVLQLNSQLHGEINPNTEFRPY